MRTDLEVRSFNPEATALSALNRSLDSGNRPGLPTEWWSPNRKEGNPGVRYLRWALLPALVATPPGREALEEYQALAKVMKPFLGLVTWPGSPESPLRIAILGGAAFGTELDAVMARATVGGRKVKISYLSAGAFVSAPPQYDVLFIDRGEENRIPNILSHIEGKPILTLGYLEGPSRKGVMVNFYLEGSRIRFEINRSRLHDVDLTVSSHLLNIAKPME